MNKNTLAKSIDMLKLILDGKTLEAVANTAGISRSAVEQRVKALARDLQTIVGVEGVDENVVPTLSILRNGKDRYLEALEHYQPERAHGMRNKKCAVSREEIDLVVERTRQTSKCKNRDTALLLVLFVTAARPLEIARLEVRDYLNENGSVRVDSMLRADAANNGVRRRIFFASAKANAAIDAYLGERVQRGQGVKKSKKYRGLDPMSKLFLTDDGNEMAVKIQRNGNHRYLYCGVLQGIYRRIFRRSGLKGVSAFSARRTVAQKLNERGIDHDDIGKMLGLKEKNSVCNLLVRPVQPLKSAVKELI